METNNLIKDYKEFLIASDKKTKRLEYSFRLLTRYLYEYNLELLCIDHKEAQEFQSWLMSQNNRFSPASIQAIISPITSM